MYRKNDERIFAVFSVLANVAVIMAFVLVLLYHFYEGSTGFRNFALSGVMISLFCKYQIILLKVYILEIRITNLMNVGRKPGKLAVSMGKVSILVYSVIFWVTVIGALLAFLPANWRPALNF